MTFGEVLRDDPEHFVIEAVYVYDNPQHLRKWILEHGFENKREDFQEIPPKELLRIYETTRRPRKFGFRKINNKWYYMPEGWGRVETKEEIPPEDVVRKYVEALANNDFDTVWDLTPNSRKDWYENKEAYKDAFKEAGIVIEKRLSDVSVEIGRHNPGQKEGIVDVQGKWGNDTGRITLLLRLKRDDGWKVDRVSAKP